jgi:hypothetical protein
MARIKKRENGFPVTWDHKPTSKYTVGWEFEIPLDECDEVSSGDKKKLKDVLQTPAHYDCGGWEVMSPVCDRASTARSFARDLKKLKFDSLDMEAYSPSDYDYSHCCGIHVHVSSATTQNRGYHKRNSYDAHKAHLKYNRNNYPVSLNQEDYRTLYSKHSEYMRAEAAFRFKGLVLNRTENARFLRAFSHRFQGNDDSEYTYNAQPNGRLYNFSMLRPNSHGDVITDEFRTWKGVSNRLLPAIDFALSFSRWADHKAKLFTEDQVIKLMATHPNRRVDLPEYPNLNDYNNWLTKRRGYKALKKDLLTCPISQ